MNDELAPIAIFVYKRPDHTQRLLNSLIDCPEFMLSPLYIFSDGAKTEVDKDGVQKTRNTVEACKHPNKNLVYREYNWGLAQSIIEGVTFLCKKYGKVIVLEDDLVVSKYLLQYMNHSLKAYERNTELMQISGYMFPVAHDSEYDAVVLPMTTSWGWGTWDRAWAHFDPSMVGFELLKNNKDLRARFDLNNSYPYFKMIQNQIEGKIDSWAIVWYLSVFMKQGVVLHPCRTLIDNMGFDESATHTTTSNRRKPVQFFEEKMDKYPPIVIDTRAMGKIEVYLKKETSLLHEVLSRIHGGCIGIFNAIKSRSLT